MRIAVVLSCIFLSKTAECGLHLGMKLACKKYGDAWSARDKHGLRNAVTADFAAVWDRMPNEMFAALPRGADGESDVIDSRKSGDGAMVRVSTSDGPITFSLVGQGFQWRVADVFTANVDGETVSLKQSLDASLAAREFMVGLSQPSSNAWSHCLSTEMSVSFAAVPADDWRRVRTYLPEFAEPAPVARPMVKFFGNLASMTVPLPECGEKAFAKVTLVRSNGWKVDDLEIGGPSLKIPSFRKGVGSLAAVATLGEFLAKPASIHPAAFVSAGKLRDEFVHAHTGSTPAPSLGEGKPQHLRICDDRNVYLLVKGKWALVCTQPSAAGRANIQQIQLHEAGAWRDAADLLALQRTVKSLPFKNWLSQATVGITASQAAATVNAN